MTAQDSSLTDDDATEVRSLDAQSRLASNGPPETIGRFRVEQLLGEGSFGCVYLAHDPKLDRAVAIKVPHGAGLAPEFRDRFLDEARATATVDHANVCPVFEVDDDGGVPFIVMRYVAGGTLANLLRRAPGTLPVPVAVRIAKKLAHGLAAAHAKGVVHRDLKPANVLYDEANDDVLITDFGLAKLLEHAGSIAGVKGTPAYMSPEQVGDGETPGDVGPLSDVYSLGVILFELLTGQSLFRGKPLAQMLAHVQKKPDRPSERVAGLDPRLDPLCLKALEKDPAERYASAKAFAEALAAYLRHAAPAEEDSPGADPGTEAEADYRRGVACAGDESPDYARAREWYERAAARGHAGARYALGRLYEEGRGVGRDCARAFELYAQAAAQGHRDAQHDLGCLYQQALGVERDYVKAREWYEKAAAQGHRGATNALAYLYASGLGVERDEAKARELYERTATAGGSNSGSDLGCIYLDGFGVDQGCANVRALQEMAAQGDEAAKKALAQLPRT